MEQKKDIYKVSRGLYIAEATLEYLVSILVSGTFIAKLSTSLGIPDSLTGIISSFVYVGCIFQLFSIFIPRGRGYKSKVIPLIIMDEVLFVLIYAIPFIDIPFELKAVVFMACKLLGNILLKIANAPKTSWYMALVDDRHRGVFTANKEIVSLVAGMVFTTVMGSVLDSAEARGDIKGGFLICGITLGVLMLSHILVVVFSKERPVENEQEKHQEPFLTRVRSLLSNKGYLKVLFVFAAWNTAVTATTAFMGTYQIKELGFSMTTISLVNIAYSVVRILFSRVLGRLADKTSFSNMFTVCALVAAAAFGINAFTRPSNGIYVYTLYYMLYGVATAGTNGALINLVFDYVPVKERSDALAISNTVYGIAGFGATWLASFAVDFVQTRGVTLFGINVYVQQLLSAFSALMILLLSVYIKKNMARSKKRF